MVLRLEGKKKKPKEGKERIYEAQIDGFSSDCFLLSVSQTELAASIIMGSHQRETVV